MDPELKIVNKWKITNKETLKEKYLQYISKLYEQIKQINSTISIISSSTKTKEIDAIEQNINECLKQLNTVINLTERIKRLLDKPIEVTEDITEFKKILETMSTGLSIIKFIIKKNVGNIKPITVGGSYTRKNSTTL